MDEACAYYFPGSRAASSVELATGAIAGLPARNDSGSGVMGTCPACVGFANSSALSGHERNYVNNGTGWPAGYLPWWAPRDGRGSTYNAACVLAVPIDCGDGFCAADEDARNCEDDCDARCGDGACTHTEDHDGCPGDCPSEALTYTGYAQLGVNVGIHDDARIDQNMDEACAYYFPGSRAASNVELATGAIAGLPARNDSGSGVMGTCPACVGFANSSALSGHERNYVLNGAGWPAGYLPWWGPRDGRGSTYNAACVLTE